MNQLIFINNTTTIDAGSAAVQNPADVVDGQIAIFDADNLQNGTLDLTGANATSRMLIVQGDDEQPLVSQIIEQDKIKDVYSKDYLAPVNQVTHIGFSGSGTNDLDTSAGDKTIKFTRLDKGFEQFPRSVTTEEVESSDIPYDVAAKFAEGINSKEGSKAFVRAEALVNQASSQLVDDDATPANVTLDVTYGSKKVIATVTSGASVDAVAGDFLRIGDATDLGFGVYEIESLEAASGTTQVINLSIAYGGETASGVAAGKLDAAPDGADEAGIEVTAKDVDEISDFVETTAVISFATGLQDFGSTVVTASVTPKTGSGTFEQVREIEKQAAGAQRSFYYRNYFPQTPEFYADEATTYDIQVIIYENDNDDSVVRQNKYTNIVLAYDTGANLTEGDFATFFGV